MHRPSGAGHRFTIAGALLLTACVLPAVRTSAEPVTHTFAGTVTYVSDGTYGGETDLTGTFSPGQPIVFSYTIERNTTPIQLSAHKAKYVDATTLFNLTIGSYTGSAAVGTELWIYDDQTEVVRRAPDEYEMLASGRISPAVGALDIFAAHLLFADHEGAAFSSTALPREFPPLAEFETRMFDFYIADYGGYNFGFVRGDFDDVSTPAHPESWGAIKALYRK